MHKAEPACLPSASGGQVGTPDPTEFRKASENDQRRTGVPTCPLLLPDCGRPDELWAHGRNARSTIRHQGDVT